MVRIRSENRRMRDGRNPYGSKGGYISSSRPRRDRGMDYELYTPEYDIRYDYSYDGRYPREEYYGNYERPKQRGRYSGSYMMDYSNDVSDKEYHHDLEEWKKKLKAKDRFNMSKDEILRKAKEMNASFNGYDEEEFYTTYLMHVSDYLNISNDPHAYIAMAKQFLEDDDIAVSPSEKLCTYLYEIVWGE